MTSHMPSGDASEGGEAAQAADGVVGFVPSVQRFRYEREDTFAISQLRGDSLEAWAYLKETRGSVNAGDVMRHLQQKGYATDIVRTLGALNELVAAGMAEEDEDHEFAMQFRARDLVDDQQRTAYRKAREAAKEVAKMQRSAGATLINVTRTNPVLRLPFKGERSARKDASWFEQLHQDVAKVYEALEAAYSSTRSEEEIEKQYLTITEVAKACELKRPRVREHLQTLFRGGAVERLDAGSRYERYRARAITDEVRDAMKRPSIRSGDLPHRSQPSA